MQGKNASAGGAGKLATHMRKTGRSLEGSLSEYGKLELNARSRCRQEGDQGAEGGWRGSSDEKRGEAADEVKTKRSALLLMEKRRQEELRVPNRSTRRQKQGNKQQSKLSAAGTTPAAESSAPSNPAGDAGPSAGPGPGSADVASASREPRDVRDPSGEEQQGMFAGIRKTLEDVNQQSYYQALALNKELEEKGILPPLERKQEEAAPASEVQQEVDSRSRKGGTEGEDAGGKIIDIVDDGAGVDGRGTSVGERAQGGPKQRRKPRGARKDKRKR